MIPDHRKIYYVNEMINLIGGFNFKMSDRLVCAIVLKHLGRVQIACNFEQKFSWKTNTTFKVTMTERNFRYFKGGNVPFASLLEILIFNA